MKKELLNILIDKFKKTLLSTDDVKRILSKDEKILEKLALLDEELFATAVDIILMYKDDRDIITAIDLLTNAREEVLPYLIKTLTDENLIKVQTDEELTYVYGNLIIRAAQIISKSKSKYNAECVYKVLTDKNAIKAGIAPDGARIVNAAENEGIAEYVCYVFTDERTIRQGKTYEFAKIICHASTPELAEILGKTLLNMTKIKTFANVGANGKGNAKVRRLQKTSEEE